MFDNEYETGNVSRLLMVTYDPATSYDTTNDSDGDNRTAAYLSWEYPLSENSPHFGDHDRLPTGNLLGCYWPVTRAVFLRACPAGDVTITVDSR